LLDKLNPKESIELFGGRTKATFFKIKQKLLFIEKFIDKKYFGDNNEFNVQPVGNCESVNVLNVNNCKNKPLDLNKTKQKLQSIEKFIEKENKKEKEETKEQKEKENMDQLKNILSENENKIIDNKENKENLDDILDWIEKEGENEEFFKSMNYFEFLDYYKKNYDNLYSKQLETLDLSNSIGAENLDLSAKNFPDNKLKILNKYRELAKQAKSKDEIPYLIYAVVNKNYPLELYANPLYSGLLFRIGYTKSSPKIRMQNYKSAANSGKVGTFYEHMKQNKYGFEMIFLDTQLGKTNAIKSETLFTMYFNRKFDSELGFDLSTNLNYNPIVGDVVNKPGKTHPQFIRYIFYSEIKNLIEKGYEEIDICFMYGISRKTLEKRIRVWWSEYGENIGFNDVAKILRGQKLKEYYSQGFTIEEIAKKFVKLDIKNKLQLLGSKTSRAAFLGNIKEKTYTIRGIEGWTEKYLGLAPSDAYEKYFVKSIITSLLQVGLEKYQALDVLKAMSIKNPNRKNSFYDADSLDRLLKQRLWSGKSWNELRQIVIEPIVEEMLRNNVNIEDIDKFFGRGKGFIMRYIRSRWGFKNALEAKKFFKEKCLGFHEYDFYIEN